jgi:hypothetical protein
MWKTISDWLLAFFNMSRELQEHRETIRQLEDRVRNTEESIKLLAQEQRHGRQLDAAEREKLVLQLERELTKQKALLSPRGKKTEMTPGCRRIGKRCFKNFRSFINTMFDPIFSAKLLLNQLIQVIQVCLLNI